MTRRRSVVIMSALALSAALAWTAVGGVTVAQGQEEPIVINRAHAGSHRPSFDRPIFILTLGSDAGSPAYKRGGTMHRGRADSIHIVAIEPRLKKASIVGIPRDSFVPLTCGGQQKINAGMFFGGPECMVGTVERLVRDHGGPANFKFDYYMVTGFEHFSGMVKDIGGITFNVPFNMDDNASRAHLRRGVQELNGAEALAVARNRHDAPGGDLGRSKNQGLLMIAGLAKARSLSAKDPGATLTFLRSIFKNVRMNIPLVESFKLGLTVLQINPKDVTNVVPPASTGNTSAGSSVILDERSYAVYRDIADDGVLGSSG
ncbi:MAG TPA: LCP family protein [Actinomycetota bacterium]|nr:LCP family protein [Actinomycetota bacterium]